MVFCQHFRGQTLSPGLLSAVFKLIVQLPHYARTARTWWRSIIRTGMLNRGSHDNSPEDFQDEIVQILNVLVLARAVGKPISNIVSSASVAAATIVCWQAAEGLLSDWYKYAIRVKDMTTSYQYFIRIFHHISLSTHIISVVLTLSRMSLLKFSYILARIYWHVPALSGFKIFERQKNDILQITQWFTVLPRAGSRAPSARSSGCLPKGRMASYY